MAIQKLLFVDANIWLDFYRARNDAGLGLLRRLETIADKIIVTYQLEMEYKKNRQGAILEGLQELKTPAQISRPGLFSDAQAVRAMQSGVKRADSSVKKLRARTRKALEKPAEHDPVYQACQRIFHKNDDLVLTREDVRRHAVRRKALRRFLLGCPPRKKADTSMGDAVNWEWMVACAISKNAELVIVSRDADYGATIDDRQFVNDHLKQEFSERVSRKRKILLYARLSEALKHFKLPVTAEEEKEEEAVLKVVEQQVADELSGDEVSRLIVVSEKGVPLEIRRDNPDKS